MDAAGEPTDIILLHKVPMATKDSNGLAFNAQALFRGDEFGRRTFRTYRLRAFNNETEGRE
jgi:hypothetical protein